MNLREPRPRVSLLRRVAIPATAALVVVLLAVFAIGLGAGAGQGSGTARPTASQAAAAFSDLPMVTVPPTATPALTATASTGLAASSAATGSASAPPSASPAPSAAGEVRANRITIARLGIDIPIVEGDGIDTPIGKAAHYPGTAWPGGGSNIYLYGHARAGMFIGLWRARVGDRIELGLVDGTSRVYVVTKVLPKVPWNAMHYLDPTRTEQLTLQTCTSNYPTAPRFIVIAVPAT